MPVRPHGAVAEKELRSARLSGPFGFVGQFDPDSRRTRRWLMLPGKIPWLSLLSKWQKTTLLGLGQVTAR